MYKNKTLLTTTVAATVFMFAATIYDPYFTPLLLSKGFSKETISFAFSVAPFSLIFFGSILGNFSDAVGRKRIQNFSLLSLIISLLLYLYIPKSFPLLIITALINVLAYQTFNDASAERIEDNLADEERGKETGRYLSITTFGAITAATFGTYLASRFPVTITFKLGIVILSVILIFGLFKKSSRRRKIERKDLNILENFKRFWRIKKLRGIGITSMSTNFGHAAKSIFVPILLTKEMGASVYFVGLFFTAMSIAHLSQYFFGKSCDRRGSGRIIFYSIICYSLVVGSLFFAPNPYIVVLTGLLYGLTMSGWNAGAVCYLSEIGERNNLEGSIFGTDVSLAYFGIFLGYISSGFLSHYLPIRYLFVIYGAVPLLSMIYAKKHLFSEEKELITI